MEPVEDFQGVETIVGRTDFVGIFREKRCEAVHQLRFVINDENPFSCHGHPFSP